MSGTIQPRRVLRDRGLYKINWWTTASLTGGLVASGALAITFAAGTPSSAAQSGNATRALPPASSTPGPAAQSGDATRALPPAPSTISTPGQKHHQTSHGSAQQAPPTLQPPSRPILPAPAQGPVNTQSGAS